MGQQAQRGVDEVAGEGVEDDVDASAVGGVRKWCSKSRVRELAMWASSKPIARSVSHLGGLAVA